LWLERPEGGVGRRPIGVLLLSGLAYVAVVAPFAALYLGSQAPASDVPLDEIRKILWSRLPPPYFNIRLALTTLVANNGGFRALPWLLALGGAAWLVWEGGERRRFAARVGVWSLAVAIVAIGGCWIDQQVARMTGGLPKAIDLMRGLRFFVPLMLLFVVGALAALHARFAADPSTRGRVAAAAVAAAGIVFTGQWASWSVPPQIETAVSCWSRGKLMCPDRLATERIEACRGIAAATRPGERFLDLTEVFPIRYGLLRPLVHSRFDIGVLLYARREALPEWQRDQIGLTAIGGIEDPLERFRAAVGMARRLGADWLVLPGRAAQRGFPIVNDVYDGHRVAWRSKWLALVRVATDAS
jgi:hypothetical protein